ncbi:periplasmic component of the Tol biopolymer transport system [Terriglobus roseus DSM 18391]|uniref:Periplasmic component of the Tol biopolymer transport system n=1 Tax=Terriglobus roseus (strain DSM 18391 / NRRL B-41598 / KBS 63) TaxID=926566 RepID=I3ZM89_TERRK|nr:amidohydrolase family protein [Terriglobus roseus]AFL90357.1 periplasmic component of the Tol biopolymer transport system [Terriglobus roseus DSM 18391]
MSSVLKSSVASLALAAVSTAGLHAAPVKPSSKSSAASITIHEATNAQVTVSPDGKTILADFQGLIYSLPMSGGPAKRLTEVVQEASHPDWSKTGDIVALQCYAGGTFHIWTMKPDGTGMKQVTFGHGDDREPRISPDGKTIVFASDRAFKTGADGSSQGSYDIWTVSITGGEPTQLTKSDADEFGPSWSPDGMKIAFVSGTGITATSIHTIDVASGKQTELLKVGGANRVEAPSWSPDAKHLAYVEFEATDARTVNAGVLKIVGADGKGTPTVAKSTDVFPFPAVWLSPTQLVYTGSGHIVKMDISSGSESAISFTAAIPYQPHGFPHKVHNFDSAVAKQVKGIYAPALSPDGKSLAFVALNQLYVMPIGGVPKAITNDTFYKQGPTWSPDGSKLAYISDRDGIENVYLHGMGDSSDANDKRVAPQPTAQIMPAWSPDGKSLAFQDQTGATLLADVASGSLKTLAASTFFPGRASFSPNGKTVAIATIRPYTKRFREGTSAILTVDLATLKQHWFDPAPFESVTTRTEDGPTYTPDGKEMIFVLSDLLYSMPVDGDGHPAGKAVKLNDETTDAPSISADSKTILYLNNGKLKLMDRATGKITPVAMPLTYTTAKPTQKLLIHAGKVWQGTGPGVLTDVDIVITDNRITSVGPHKSTPPAGITRTIEAPDSTVMPGLWENHAHPDSDNGIYYGARMGRLWLSYGVTTTRGIADNAYRSVEHNESYRAGAAVGPRTFSTGEAVDGERVYYPMMIATTSEAQLQREFLRLKALDFDMVKLYVRLPFAWAKKGIDFAHTQMGVDTASHYLLPAVALGEDGMSHLSATSRFGWAYSRSLTGHSYDDVQTLLAKSGMWTISTTFAQAQYAEDPAMPNDPRQGVAPPWEHARVVTAFNTAKANDQKSAYIHLRDEESTVANDFHTGGIVLAGTDSPLDIPATSLHLNLRAQVKYGGMKPWEALTTATSMAAKAYGYGKDLGTLETGKLADLIIVGGDPLTAIDDVAKVQCVAVNGRLQSVDEIAAPFAKDVPKNNVCSK